MSTTSSPTDPTRARIDSVPSPSYDNSSMELQPDASLVPSDTQGSHDGPEHSSDQLDQSITADMDVTANDTIRSAHPDESVSARVDVNSTIDLPSNFFDITHELNHAPVQPTADASVKPVEADGMTIDLPPGSFDVSTISSTHSHSQSGTIRTTVPVVGVAREEGDGTTIDLPTGFFDTSKISPTSVQPGAPNDAERTTSAALPEGHTTTIDLPSGFFDISAVSGPDAGAALPGGDGATIELPSNFFDASNVSTSIHVPHEPVTPAPAEHGEHEDESPTSESRDDTVDAPAQTSRPTFAPLVRAPHARHSMAVSLLHPSQRPTVSPQRVSPRAAFAPSCPPPSSTSRPRRRLPRRSLPVTYFGDTPSRRKGRASLGTIPLSSKYSSVDGKDDEAGDEPMSQSSISEQEEPVEQSSPSTQSEQSDSEPIQPDTPSDEDEDAGDWRAEAHIRTHRRLRRDSLDFARARRRTLDPSMFLHQHGDDTDGSARAETSQPRRSAPFLPSSSYPLNGSFGEFRTSSGSALHSDGESQEEAQEEDSSDVSEGGDELDDSVDHDEFTAMMGPLVQFEAQLEAEAPGRAGATVPPVESDSSVITSLAELFDAQPQDNPESSPAAQDLAQNQPAEDIGSSPSPADLLWADAEATDDQHATPRPTTAPPQIQVGRASSPTKATVAPTAKLFTDGFSPITRMYSSWKLHSPSAAHQGSPRQYQPVTPLRGFMQSMSGPRYPGQVPDFGSILAKRSPVPCHTADPSTFLDDMSFMSSPGMGKPSNAAADRLPIDDLANDMDLFPNHSDDPRNMSRGKEFSSPTRQAISSPGRTTRARAAAARNMGQDKENAPAFAPALPLTPSSKDSSFKPSTFTPSHGATLSVSSRHQPASQYNNQAILRDWSENLLRSLSPVKQPKSSSRKRARSASPSKPSRVRPRVDLAEVQGEASPLAPPADATPKPAIAPPAPPATLSPVLVFPPVGAPEDDDPTPTRPRQQSVKRAASPDSSEIPGDSEPKQNITHTDSGGSDGVPRGTMPHGASGIATAVPRPTKRIRIERGTSTAAAAAAARVLLPPSTALPPSARPAGHQRSALPAPRTRLAAPGRSVLPRPTPAAASAASASKVPAAMGCTRVATRAQPPRLHSSATSSTISSLRAPRTAPPTKATACSASATAALNSAASRTQPVSATVVRRSVSASGAQQPARTASTVKVPASSRQPASSTVTTKAAAPRASTRLPAPSASTNAGPAHRRFGTSAPGARTTSASTASTLGTKARARGAVAPNGLSGAPSESASTRLPRPISVTGLRAPNATRTVPSTRLRPGIHTKEASHPVPRSAGLATAPSAPANAPVSPVEHATPSAEPSQDQAVTDATPMDSPHESELDASEGGDSSQPIPAAEDQKQVDTVPAEYVKMHPVNEPEQEPDDNGPSAPNGQVDVPDATPSTTQPTHLEAPSSASAEEETGNEASSQEPQASGSEDKASTSDPEPAVGPAPSSDAEVPTESEAESQDEQAAVLAVAEDEPMEAESEPSPQAPSEGEALRSSNAARRRTQRVLANLPPSSSSRRAQRVHLNSPTKAIAPAHSQRKASSSESSSAPAEVHTVHAPAHSGSDSVRGSNKPIIRVAGLKWREETAAAKAALKSSVREASTSRSYSGYSTHSINVSPTKPSSSYTSSQGSTSAPVRSGPVAIRNAWRKPRGLESDKSTPWPSSDSTSAGPSSGTDQPTEPAPLPVIRKVTPAPTPQSAPAREQASAPSTSDDPIATSRPIRAVRVRSTSTEPTPSAREPTPSTSSVRSKSASSGALPLSKTELTRLTNANTRRNEMVSVQLEFRQLSLDRPRPPSPSAHIPRLTQVSKEQAASERAIRANKRAGVLPNEEDDQAGEWYEDEFGERRRRHRQGAGESSPYRSPLRAYKAKAVHWAPELFLGPADRHSTVGDEEMAELSVRPVPDTTVRPRKSLLALPYSLDRMGNVPESTMPLDKKLYTNLKRTRVVIQQKTYVDDQ